MGVLLSPESLTRDIAALAANKYLVDPFDLIDDGLDFFRPPERISTLECAEKYRRFRTTEGEAMVPYDRWRTPYNIAKMDALDDPRVNLVVIVKPSRSGGTTVAENYLFKMMMFGPMGDVGWYLGSQDAVKKYCDRVIKPMFEDHPSIMAKVGSGKSDNNDASKRIGGHLVEWLPANDNAFRNREFVFGVMDEPDGWTKFSETPETQLSGRQKNVGSRRKGIIMSHPDKGWKAGTAAAWESSSRGIYIMRCVECERFAAAHATKYWPDVPEFKLDYVKLKHASFDERLRMAEETAGMACPHCGTVLNDQQRFAMIDEAGKNGWWMHRGQTLDIDRGIEGEREPNAKVGFWDHGLMLKVSPAAELAKALEEAMIKYERSGGRRVKELREVLSKQFGEIFAGKADIEGVSSADLQKRVGGENVLRVGEFPPEALFITCAIDVGSGKFDVSFRAWDLEGRSWWLDRYTTRQRPGADGRLRDIATRERIEDWEHLVDEVVLRTFPIKGDPEGRHMPVALTLIDVSDGNVTMKGREFARRCFKRGLIWGRGERFVPRVQLIQGSPNARATEVPELPNKQDSKGRRFPRGVWEWTLGVFKLKELALERLGVRDGGPGQCQFAEGIEAKYFDEYFNEPLVDGKFERNGPNESLDCFGYEEAARIILKPDRKDIDWIGGKLPVWAKPFIPMPEGGDQQAAAPMAAGATKAASNIAQRFAALNKR